MNWSTVNKVPANIDTMLLLTDGSVMAHGNQSSNWYRLIPDNGSYANGTWKQTASMLNDSNLPATQNGPTYAPQFFGSAVLKDGTLLVFGGEYNVKFCSTCAVDALEVQLYDPVTDSWTILPTPSGWANIGDPSSTVLADGRVLFGNAVNTQIVIFDPQTQAYSFTSSKNDASSEETFTLLPKGDVLTVQCTTTPNSELYTPSTDTWLQMGSTGVSLPQPCSGVVAEIGPAILLPSGKVFCIGATGNTAVYTPGAAGTAGTWSNGPTLVDSSNNTMFPMDAPAVLLTDGTVLLTASPSPPCKYPKPTTFYIYDPSTNKSTITDGPSNSDGPCFTGRFLLLPSGEVLYSNQSGTVSILSSVGGAQASWAPTITKCPSALILGHSYKIFGTQFNGLSQACSYGDDAQMATNYPIVRLQDNSGNVHYLRTSNHSTMGVATGDTPVSTIVSVPTDIPAGNYNLFVVANGIPSAAQAVTIAAQLPQIVVNLEDNLDFAVVCGGDRAYLTLTVFNVGNADLIVDAVSNIAGSGGFTILPNPTTPLTIESGDEVDFTVEFMPTSTVFESATIRIASNDPVTPNLDVVASGTCGIAALDTVIPDNGDFGNVCLGSFVDEVLTINNSGTCPLLIFDITGSPGFLPPSVVFYPLRVDGGESIDVVVRFQPSTHGPQPGTITFVSNDAGSPHVVAVKGAAPAPTANLIIADTGDFGEVRLGRFVDRDLVINNRGPCPLSVTAIVSSAPTFVTPQVVSFPLTVEGGDSIAVPIRFQPTNRGSATATLTIVSDDPNSPALVHVSGTAWPPLPLAGSALEGFPLNDDSQHVFFIGTDKFVHELDIAAGTIWADHDLTTLAGAVPPTPISALTGYPLNDQSKHVFFIGTDNHVYELYFTAGTGWVFNDLTSLARAVPPTPTSALTGHSLSDHSKHVFFIGTDNHVHELFIAPGGRWADNDLTALATAKPPTPTSALTSYRLGDDSQHVFFIGTDNHVHELYIHTGAGWVDNNLTTLAGAVPPTPASALTGFPLGPPLGDNSQHVFFIGTDGHVHELDIAGAGWNDHDLTTLAGAVAPTLTSALTGYPLSNNSKHVFFIGTDSHVHELYFADAGWLDNDLTALT